MTRDPERLLSRHGADGSLERELLASLRAESPPAAARDQVWGGVAQQIALLGAAGAGASLSASTAAATTQTGTGIAAASGMNAALLASKTLLVKAGLALGLTALGAGGVALYAAEPAKPVIDARGPLPQPPPPRAVTPPPPELPRSEVPLAPSKRHRWEPPERLMATDAEHATLLNRESALLIQARSELRSGDVAKASSTLADLDRRVPRGMLGQEREVLRIELLAARGKLAAAKARAQAFMRTYPTSPHSSKLTRFLKEP